VNVPPQRVSPIQSPDAYALPGRPEGAPAPVLDAFRQTQFLLGGDLALFEQAMNLQLRLVKDAYPSRFRSHTLAGITAMWSRVYFCLGDAMLLALRGSYPSTLPLIRTACEFELGRFFAGEVLASDAVLRAVYRPVSDLGRPNFGATLLQIAPESNNNRLAIAFADASFHLGWAELVVGWLLALSARQLRVIVDA
jgi:hypothetical protein